MTAAHAYGWLAEFDDAGQLLGATLRARQAGYTRLEAYAPFPVEGLAEALGPGRDRVPAMVLLGGLCGGLGTFALETYAATVAYPMNIGGRPDFSWPAFLPPALEMTVLFAALFGTVAMLRGNGLPRLRHPLFAVDRFRAASRNGFFLVLRDGDPRIEDEAAARGFLENLAPRALTRVPA